MDLMQRETACAVHGQRLWCVPPGSLQVSEILPTLAHFKSSRKALIEPTYHFSALVACNLPNSFVLHVTWVLVHIQHYMEKCSTLSSCHTETCH